MLRDIILNNLPEKHEAFEAEGTLARQSAMTMEEMEEEMIRKTLTSVNGNRREAARKLGIGERTLYRKLKKYGII